jgi:hypothetical protein
MIHPDTELRWIDDKIGYGVFVTRPIPKGTLVWIRCALDIALSPAQTAQLGDAYRPIFDHFAYFDSVGNAILCWDNARYVNHSCQPAMMPVGEEAEIAVRDLEPGDHLTCDYAYCNIKLECSCGEPNCRSRVQAADLFVDGVDAASRTRAAIVQASGVPQPLLVYARQRDQLDPLLSGRTDLPAYSIFHCPSQA